VFEIRLAYERLRAKTKKYSGQQSRLEQEHAHASYSVAKAMALGLAWIYFNSGRLRNARPLLMSARVLLERTTDDLHRAFVDMILGCIERTEAGLDHARCATLSAGVITSVSYRL
jgi:hypothetical protein